MGVHTDICAHIHDRAAHASLSLFLSISRCARSLGCGVGTVQWNNPKVPPEQGLKFRWDSETCWCFLHVTVKLVSGTTQRSINESCITVTHVSSSIRETVRRARTVSLWNRGPKEGDAKSVSLSLSLKLRAAAAGMLLFSAVCLCTTSYANDKMDLAEWSSADWSTRVDGAMGK